MSRIEVHRRPACAPNQRIPERRMGPSQDRFKSRERDCNPWGSRIRAFNRCRVDRSPAHTRTGPECAPPRHV